MPKEDLESMTVHPTGSTRSKIIKDVNISLIKKITKKIDSKSFKGRLLHCRPHVPVSPPKKESIHIIPAEENHAKVDSKEDEETKSDSEKKNQGELVEQTKENELQKQSSIPGLL